MLDIEPSKWWRPDRHADRRPFLVARAAIAAGLRRWFADHGFTEIETGILQRSPGNETHLHAPAARVMSADGEAGTLYFRTSPEFACKKLIAAGEQRIVEFARVFRDRERGDLHLPEFTMLEWYRANETFDAVVDDCLAIITEAARIAGTKHFAFRGRAADPFAEAQRLTVADAFEQFAGIDLLATLFDRNGNREAFAGAARGKVRLDDNDTWSDIFSKVLVEHVEPKLGQGRLTVLYDYPAPESALARRRQHDPRVCERFEIYACGVELANGFGELTDSDEQRARFEAAMDERERRYGERYPIDDDFISAVGVMPAASGVAVGFDRLVMLASGATRIDQVTWTPPAEPIR